MKKYINTILIIIFTLLLLGSGYTYTMYHQLKDRYNKVVTNEKVFLLENDSLKTNIRALTLTLDKLESSHNSALISLNKARKDLKIKDKEIEYLQNVKTEVYITDTLRLKDTIFIKESFKLDTLLGNKWYSSNLRLEYPNKIDINFNYNSDLYIAVYNKKETIDIPKKCWIGRLFQKKHNVTRVEVKDNNPYSNIKDQTFVIIE